MFREEKRDAHSVPDPSWRVGGGARKATVPVPPGKERRLAGETRCPGLGEDGLNEAEAPGGGGGSRATRAGSGYGGARGSRSLARGSGRSAARPRPLPGSVAGEAGGPGPRGGRARVLVRSWDKAPSLWRSRDSDLSTLIFLTPTFNNGWLFGLFCPVCNGCDLNALWLGVWSNILPQILMSRVAWTQSGTLFVAKTSLVLTNFIIEDLEGKVNNFFRSLQVVTLKCSPKN